MKRIRHTESVSVYDNLVAQGMFAHGAHDRVRGELLVIEACRPPRQSHMIDTDINPQVADHSSGTNANNVSNVVLD